jgi:hypothetical protein
VNVGSLRSRLLEAALRRELVVLPRGAVGGRVSGFEARPGTGTHPKLRRRRRTFAATHGFCIVSKDEDFQQRSFLRGHPPKVVWVRKGNCSTREIERLLLEHSKDLIEFDAHKDASFLALS